MPFIKVASPETDRLPVLLSEIGARASKNLALAAAVDISRVLPKVGMKTVSVASGVCPRLQLPAVPQRLVDVPVQILVIAGLSVG